MRITAPRITALRATVVAILTASALYVGVWATGWPRGFYDAFPGLHRVWVGVDGPFNEHLVRDVGALYLALGVAGILVLAWRGSRETLLLGAAWTTFSVPHLVYHVHHLGQYEPIDQVGNVIALGGTLLLAVALLVPRRARTNQRKGEPS